jgi:hypothetical protein
VRDARDGLAAIASELRERADGLVELKRRPPAAALPPPRLLGSYEPVLLGWTSRELILADHEPRVVSGGLFRPFALARGKAIATWTISAERVALEPFGRFTPADRAALEREAKDVTRFLAA